MEQTTSTCPKQSCAQVRTHALAYAPIVNTIVDHRTSVTGEGMVVQTKVLYICEGKYVAILPIYWRGISVFESVHNVRVILRE